VACPCILSLAGAAHAQDPEPGIEVAPPGGTPTGTPVEPGEPASDQLPRAGGVKRKSTSGIGLAPDVTLVSGQVVRDEAAGDAWEFTFKGFFRAPMRVGIGEAGGQTQFHAPPVIPDGNYTDWQYTNANPGPWVEMLFQYGNGRARMTTALASYNITSGGWRELQAQLGIDRAFLTLFFPDALGNIGGLAWNVGVFSDRYGTAGRYDAGMYETYLIARTRMAGSTLSANLFLTDNVTLLLEHGIGAKLDQQLWTPRADGMPFPYASYEPYPGPRQQGTTLLHHAHAGVAIAEQLTVTGHYMNAWTRDDRASMGDADGSIQVIGVDAKFIGGRFGEGYVGFSNINATNAVLVSDAIEVLHSQGGWQLTNNYFGGDGNGAMNTVLFQYRFSLAALMVHPAAWWGDGADVVATVFGMYNSITEQETVPNNGPGTKKFKAGADVHYTPLPFVGVGARLDLVRPDLDDAARSFAVLSPRIVFKTNFVTHEQVIIQYSLYDNNSRTALPFPFGGPGAPPIYSMTGPDKGVFTISASMWW
jgi:hypothetical protein